MERKRKHEYLNLARLRERKVIRGLFRGLKNNEISKAYNIPQSTLRQIMARLCARYGIADNGGMRGETNRIKLAVRLYYAGCCTCTGCRSDRGRLRANGDRTTPEDAYNLQCGSRERLEDSSLRKRTTQKTQNWQLSRDATMPQAMHVESRS